MQPELAKRIAYGRQVRERADCLIEAHGEEALTEARVAIAMAGTTAAERNFWEAVADRVARVTGMPRANHEA